MLGGRSAVSRRAVFGRAVRARVMKSLLFSVCLLLCSSASVGAVEEAPRLTDREIIERLTRLEAGQQALERHMDQRLDDLEQRVSLRIDGLEQRIDSLERLMLGGFGMLFAGMFSLVGFVIWDRRSALAPAVRGLEEMREREHRLEEVLRKYAARTPELAEEGLAREVVHRIQGLRRSANFEVTDHIETWYDGPEELAGVMSGSFAAYIREETLSDLLESGPPPDGAKSETAKIDGQEITLAVRRVGF